MKCCECGKGMSQVDAMIPIDKPGTNDRRWKCTDCASNAEVQKIENDVRELCEIINPGCMKNKGA